MNYEVFPIFPTVIAANKIKEDLSSFKKAIQNIGYNSTNSEGSINSYISEDTSVLKSFPLVEKIILNEFNQFKNEILRLETTEFKITTSWTTKTLPGGYCQYHNHKNSYYSGVLYFDKLSSGNITFSSIGMDNSSFGVIPTDYNLYNLKSFDVWPDENLIIFFPSNVYHKINLYQEDTIRHSLAFNIMPIGDIGNGDSRMNITVHNI